MIRNYELTLLARQDASDEDIKMALQTLRDIILSNNSSILYAEYWGLRQLEYQINKNDAAHFYFIQFKSDIETNKLIEEKLSTSEIFIRYLLVKADEDGIKLKSANAIADGDQSEDGITIDKRYLNVLKNVFNLNS
ncbi:MAG: 30S ribosomal protein S6 [Rickettsiales bacterium]|nr:30S ribosomal protein S6 [Rickettsiales bacterium]